MAGLVMPLFGIIAIALTVTSAAGRGIGARKPAPGELARVAVAVQAAGAGRLTDAFRSDLDRSGAAEWVAITRRTYEKGHPLGGEIIVLQPKNGTLRPVWRQKRLNPWKLDIGDVDGDGKQEIVVGVWKKSPKDPVMAKRPFVYSWNGSRLLLEWLGSRLSRRFDDFALADVDRDGRQELLALERAAKGRHRVAAYRWRSFGFDWLGCSAETPGAIRLTSGKGGPALKTATGKLSIRYLRGRLKLVK